jgi:hypothetical protein
MATPAAAVKLPANLKKQSRSIKITAVKTA